MKSAKNDHLMPLSGFDPMGEVFVYNNSVLRGIFNGHDKTVKEVFDSLKSLNFLGIDIVQTNIFNGQLPEGLNYPLILEHEMIPFISYAHEWTPSMLKDAALSQIRLMKALMKANLILKDCGMTTNVLFKGARPVHVDFLSIIQKGELTKEDWLKSSAFITPLQVLWSEYAGCFNQVFRAMFFPCMLYPLHLILFKGYHYAVKRIYETHMNTSTATITEKETFAGAPNPSSTDYFKGLSAMEFALVHDNYFDFIDILEDMVKGLNVALRTSAYINYYDEKGENFSLLDKDKWKAKQLIIDEALDTLKPNTVLDIGANTGWFSMLAAHKGADVLSIDNDSACMDVLYEKARLDNLSITPLVVDFINPLPDKYADTKIGDDPHIRQSLFPFNKMPLILSPERRFKCDLVIALAVIHHFVLGAGMNLRDCLRRLIEYCKHSLMIEFVDKNDPLIRGEPPFFKAYQRDPDGFECYHLDECLKTLEANFKSVEMKALNDTRTLIVCSEKIS